MGKWLVCARHPCNDFASKFGNCLIYDDAAGFVSNLRRALSEEPSALSEEELEELGWAAATRRLGEAARRGAGKEREEGQLQRAGKSLSGDGGGGELEGSSSAAALRKRPSSSRNGGSSSRHFHHHHQHHHHHHHHLHVVDDKSSKKPRSEGSEDEGERELRERLALEEALTSIPIDDVDDTSLMIAKARLSAAANALAEAAFARAYAALLRVEPLRVAVGAGARTTVRLFSKFFLFFSFRVEFFF